VKMSLKQVLRDRYLTFSLVLLKIAPAQLFCGAKSGWEGPSDPWFQRRQIGFT